MFQMELPKSVPLVTREDSDVAQSIFEIRVDFTQICIVCSILTIQVYNTLLNIDREVKHFWMKPFNHITVVYFVNHYVAILSVAARSIVYWFMGMSIWVNITLIDYILLCRVLALYSKGRVITIVLTILFIGDTALVGGFNIFYTLQYQYFLYEYAPRWIICTLEPSGTPPSPWIEAMLWIPSLAFGLILTFLALYKSAEYWKKSLTNLSNCGLVKVVVLDQVLYFACTILVYVIQILASLPNGIDNFWFLDICYYYVNVQLLSIVGSYMLFHLKEAAELGVNEGTSYRGSISDISFA